MKPNLQAAAPHLTIYFATVVLNKSAYVWNLGFTTQFYKYACAETPEEAEKLIAQWAAEQDCDLKRVVVGAGAVRQDINTYTFPHQIINLPKEVLEAVYRYRDYPPDYCDPGQYILNRVRG